MPLRAKKKKVSAKKEKYAKFHKEKVGTSDLSMPELTAEQVKTARAQEDQLAKFWRFNKNPPTKEIKDKKKKTK